MLAVFFALLPPSRPALGQGLRGNATTSSRYIEIRPILRDSVPIDQTQRQPNGSYTYQGSAVTCVEGLPYCFRYLSADVEHAITLTQDVSFTAWGLGVRGLSAAVMLRARIDGGSFTWPRADDPFDAMLAYAELDRDSWRVRLGRQRSSSGLGFAGYDGVSAIVQPHARIQVEGFAGRSLARGLDEPRNEALRGLEDFLLDRDAWLFGGSVRVEPRSGIVVAGRYQREIWSDRSGLLSERASVDARVPLPGRSTATASLDYDFAFGRIGKSNLTISTPLAQGAVTLEAAAVRYLPYFELWTIWGFFEPAAWHETELRAVWRTGSHLTLRLRGGWRWYDDTNTTIILSELPDQAKRASIAAHLRLDDSWSLDSDYAIEAGFGAFLSTGTVMTRWQATDALSLTINGIAFQQIEEFRVGEGTVLGGGLAAALTVSERTAFDVGASLYRQAFDGRDGMPDWNQVRGFAALRIGFGSDPGTRARRR